MKRAIILVIDGLRIGKLPDAAIYGYNGGIVIGSVLKTHPNLTLPVMNSLGFSSIEGIEGLHVPGKILGAYGRAVKKSKGKDTTTGYWELVGIVSQDGDQLHPNCSTELASKSPESYGRVPSMLGGSGAQPRATLLEWIQKSGMMVKAVGEINDIFAGRGITETIHAVSNTDAIDKTILYLRQEFAGLIFATLKRFDFNIMYECQKNLEAYADVLEQFDRDLKRILPELKEEDVLFVCAVHRNEPGLRATNHTIEYTPVLIFGNGVRAACDIGTLDSFADIGKTVAEYLDIPYDGEGTSFLPLIT